MGLLILPQRFRSQPQNSPTLRPAYRDAYLLSLFNDGSGKDISNYKNHLIPGVAPTPVIRRHGKALNFDGSSTRLLSTFNVDTFPAFTVFAWVRPAALNSGYVRIAETAYDTQFFLGANTGTQYAWIINNSSLEGCIGGQQVVGQRDFICGTFDGTNRYLYVNGVQVGSASATAPSPGAIPLAIGSFPSGGGGLIWNGDIDTFGIYPRAFTAPTIWALYQDPWRIFETPSKRIWTSAGGSSVSGSLAYTNKNDTLAASGTTTVTGSLAKTNANDTSAASGTTTVKGTLARTNANDTISAAGTTTVTGSLAKTNANDTCNSSGSVGSSVSGSLAYTNNNDTVSAVGTTTIVGTLAKTNANDTAAAAGTTTVVGSLAKTNSNDTCAASGTAGSATITGSLAYTNHNDTAVAVGTTTIKGSLAYINNNDRLSAFGTINNGIVFEASLLTGATASDRIKKPGIPSGTPDWLKTSLEILEGRRDNAITPPAAQALTFSASPTKAECEALFAYVNTIRDALEQLLNRMDG